MNFPVNEPMIDLSGLKTMTDGMTKPGYHVVEIAKAEIKVAATGARMVYLDFRAQDGTKSSDRFTIQHPRATTDEKAAKAQEIGLRKLKTLLTYGVAPAGRPPLDPNSFKGVSTLLGVTVGTLIVKGPDFQGNDGTTKTGGAEVTGYGRPYFKPEEIPALAAAYVAPIAPAPKAQDAGRSSSTKAPF
jgi:hypothetical protein